MKDGGEQRKKEALSESAVYDEWRKYVSLITTITFCIVNTYVSRYPQMHVGSWKTHSNILQSETSFGLYCTYYKCTVCTALFVEIEFVGCSHTSLVKNRQ